MWGLDTRARQLRIARRETHETVIRICLAVVPMGVHRTSLDLSIESAELWWGVVGVLDGGWIMCVLDHNMLAVARTDSAPLRYAANATQQAE